MRLPLQKTCFVSAALVTILLAGYATPPSGAATAQPTAPGAPQPAAKPSLPADEAAAAAADKIVIAFPQGSTTLTPEANQKLDLAARLFRDASPVVMWTSGYADQTGNEYNNLLLSAQRAEAVKRGLVARGIPADKLLLQAFGQSDPANKTNPTAAENRRVVVTWRLTT